MQVRDEVLERGEDLHPVPPPVCHLENEYIHKCTFLLETFIQVL